jgi:hypothetical protein
MGNQYVSNSGLNFSILNQTGKQCIIQFEQTGFVRKANIDNIKAGKVRDLYAASIYGKGYYGEFEKVVFWKQAKQLWQNMLKRCYCEADTRGYFGKVTVDPSWHCLSKFIEDIQTLDNFEGWLEGQNSNRLKYNLDKDTIVEGCKVYSKETCKFITERENKSMGAKNGKPFTQNKKMALV